MTRIGIVANPRKPGIGELIDNFLSSLKERSLEGLLAEDLKAVTTRGTVFCSDEELRTRADLIVAFGGDGTILEAARIVGDSSVPILGVNTGRLGFLTQTSPQHLHAAMDNVLAGRYRLDSRMVLEGRASSEREVKHFALNDIVIERGLSARAIRIRIFVAAELVDVCTADGVIISTPTGSTGYSLSAGGPILHPTMDALVITPICPHSLSVRPLIVSGDQEVTVEVRSDHDEMTLTADGQPACTLASGDRVSVRKSSHAVQLVDLQEQTFYGVLRKKLAWGASGNKA